MRADHSVSLLKCEVKLSSSSGLESQDLSLSLFKFCVVFAGTSLISAIFLKCGVDMAQKLYILILCCFGGPRYYVLGLNILEQIGKKLIFCLLVFDVNS